MTKNLQRSGWLLQKKILWKVFKMIKGHVFSGVTKRDRPLFKAYLFLSNQQFNKLFSLIYY